VFDGWVGWIGGLGWWVGLVGWVGFRVRLIKKRNMQ
jgi:hypothetical protein